MMLLLPIMAFAQNFTDSNLPIVVIDTDGGVNIPDEPKVLGTMKIIWHQDGSRNYLTDINSPEFLNYDGRIGIETRGSSSQMLPKKPYGLETLQSDDVTNNNVSILGMPKENDWILNSLAFDQTGMRDVISYELYENLGQYSSRRVYCEVVINGDYKGLYVFMEKIKADDNRVNIQKMDQNCNSYPEVTGGYIVQTDRSDYTSPAAWTMPGYSSGWPGSATATFVHHYPKHDDITTTQNTYIKNVFMNLATQAGNHNLSLTNGIPSIIDVASFVDFMIIAEFSSNVDVYQLSTFFHKDRKGKLRAGPIWDYNLAYGHDEFGNRSRYDVWQFNNEDNNGPKFWKDLFDTNMFRCYLARRWTEVTATGNVLDYNMLCDRMDEIDQWIAEGVERNNQRWHTMNQHASEVQAMKNWIQQRIDWLDQNISSSFNCDYPDLPSLVISRINYNPLPNDTIDGNNYEFIEISNNSDASVDLTGVYLRNLGVTYTFPVGSSLEAHAKLVLCSDSLSFIERYNRIPFGQYLRKLSNKSEDIVIANAWGDVIDQVKYAETEPWPIEADGLGAFLQLIDLNMDNSLPESWVASYDFDNVEALSEGSISIYPNPSSGIINISTEEDMISVEVFDITGKRMAVYRSRTIDLSNLPNGLYNLRISTAGKSVVGKIALMH